MYWQIITIWWVPEKFPVKYPVTFFTVYVDISVVVKCQEIHEMDNDDKSGHYHRVT